MTPYQIAIEQLERAARIAEIDPQAIEILKHPQRVIRVSIPVRMDNGSIKVFTGYRSQHNNALGPYKGGVRYHPSVTMDEVIALSMWMTWKVSLAGLPLGGGKGGVAVNPKELSKGELERLTRGYVRAIAPFIGPDVDVPAPDVGTDAQVMAWFLDEYEKVVRATRKGVVTSKPVELGGSLGRIYSTGYGVAVITREAVKEFLEEKSPEELTVAIQGYGNVGSYTAIFLHEMGFKIVAVSDSKGGIYSKDGLDPKKVLEHKKKTRSVVGYKEAKTITNKELLELDVDILIPAALENVITSENMKNIKAKLIVEGANGPTTPEAEEYLFKEKKSLVVPDFLANAGGVIVSFFEQVQNWTWTQWSEDEVKRRLEAQMITAFKKVVDEWNRLDKKVVLRDAAMSIAVRRVADAMKLRGWY
ncbi:MAG TPA: Glu/Leu/Phe/Val dehydrogenase [Thermoprotei archaeon]|nr:Glu/Leu/Phe/Val dehydrogenase [Thermoprotei archaeon]